jgi:hypothetical protein
MSYEEAKMSIRKYHMSEIGKLARQRANKRYFLKLMSTKEGRAKKSKYNQQYLNKKKEKSSK